MNGKGGVGSLTIGKALKHIKIHVKIYLLLNIFQSCSVGLIGVFARLILDPGPTPLCSGRHLWLTSEQGKFPVRFWEEKLNPLRIVSGRASVVKTLQN